MMVKLKLSVMGVLLISVMGCLSYVLDYDIIANKEWGDGISVVVNKLDTTKDRVATTKDRVATSMAYMGPVGVGKLRADTCNIEPRLGSTLRDTQLRMGVTQKIKKGVPNGEKRCRSHVKTYMGYHMVTSKRSAQYKLLNSVQAWTDEHGLRMVGDRYCIAMGTGYTAKIGTKIDVHMMSGEVLSCILGDVKSDRHTDNTNRYHTIDGSVVEFIVDASIFNAKKPKGAGNVSFIEGFEGKIDYVEIYLDLVKD